MAKITQGNGKKLNASEARASISLHKIAQKKPVLFSIYYIILLIVRETFRLNEGSGVEIGKLNLQSQPGLEPPHR